MARTGRTVEVAEGVTRILLGVTPADEETLGRLEAWVEEHVDVWSPVMHTRSRSELVEVLASLDDAVGDVAVTFTDRLEERSRVLLTWMASGRFIRPAVVDDDRLLEPTGAVLRAVGATSVHVSGGGRVDRVRCYFDRLSVLEQVAAVPGRAGVR
jgi:hypothetical protein